MIKLLHRDTSRNSIMKLLMEKMNKRIALTFVFGLVALSFSYSQSNRKMNLANEMVENLQYADAIDMYKLVYKKYQTDLVRIKIAECYASINDPEQEVQWFDLVEDKQAMSPEDHYNYAQALTTLGRFDDAKKWYEVYKTEAPDDLRASNKVYALEHLDEYYKDSAKYEVEELEKVNSEKAEFSPAFYLDGIVFPSSRVFQHRSKRTFKFDNSNYLDLFYAENNDSLDVFSYSDPVHFSNTINTKYHEGALTFSGDNSKVIFTRNNYFHKRKNKSTDGITLLSLYFAEHSENKDGVHGWHHVVELPFNSNEYSVTDPSATKDFSVLYFASDMPGGYGGLDIYKSEFKNGNWSTPQNLGPEINTSGEDCYPFIHENGTLYYASNGKPGIGGLDIYEAKPEGDGWYVHDMGFPINSPRDDFGFILDDTEKYGYFSSNRIGGTGGDDIYKFNMKNVSLTVFGDLFVKLEGAEDDTKTILPEGEIVIYDKTKGVYVDTLTSNQLGEFEITLYKGSIYAFRASKDTLLPDEYILDLSKMDQRESDSLDLVLQEPLPDVVRLIVDVKEKDTENPLVNATVYVLNQSTYEIISTTTNSKGQAVFALEPNTEYTIKGTKVQYIADCASFNSGDLQKESKTTERPLFLSKFKVSDKFKIENVYFEFNSDKITPQAAIELDKVVSFINANPGISLELGSHTDSRGTDSYNKDLSSRRAASSVNYIVNQGIASGIITSQGYGEDSLVNHCANGVKCTEVQHGANRRTEIKITGIKQLSPEEEEELEKNKKGLTKEDDLSVCEHIELLTLKND